jgi:hypothetical protein
VCDQLGTEIQIGPTGVVTLPMPTVPRTSSVLASGAPAGG